MGRRMPDVELNLHEARALGVLIEKAATTPDQYPLSLNALMNGCNQKSNRAPVVDFLEAEVDVAVQGLCHKGFAGRVASAGHRVEKFRHSAGQRLGIAPPELAVLAELLMRGPQSPGELRQRAARMSPIASLGELATHLDSLREEGLIERLGPVPGSRAERWCQLLSPGLHPVEASDPAPAATPAVSARADLSQRVEELEAEVARLRGQLRDLASRLGEELDG